MTVNVNGDLAPESNENFVVNLSAPSNASFCDAQGAGTIMNDDAAAVALSTTVGVPVATSTIQVPALSNIGLMFLIAGFLGLGVVLIQRRQD